MKVKLKAIVNGEVINKIAKIKNEDNKLILMYKESPTANVEVHCVENEIRVVKTGPVEIDYTHELGKTTECFYQVKMGNQSFSGTSKIKTTKIDVLNQKILLEYTRDGEKVIQAWEY